MEIPESSGKELLTNGPGAAAVLSAGIGAFGLGVCTAASEVSVPLRSVFNVYKPTGPLSGVTTMAVLVWLAAWALFAWRWKTRTVRLSMVAGVAAVLLGLGILLTFPPVFDLL